MIAYQNSKEHQEFVEEIKSEMMEVERVVKSVPYTSAAKYKEETELPKIFKRIDKLLSDRFKCNFKHTIVDDGNYGILLASTVDTRDIIKNSRSNFKKLKRILTMEKTLKADAREMYHRMYDNIAAVTRQFRTNGVGINLATAELINMPDNVVIEIIISPNNLFNKMKFGYKAALSALFHEISHLLTFIEYSDLAYGTSIKINEVIKSKVKNKDIKIMKVILKDEDLKEDNITRLYTVGQLADLPNKLFNNDFNYKREAERVADMGALRLWKDIEMGKALEASATSNISLSKLLYQMLVPSMIYLVIGAVFMTLGGGVGAFFLTLAGVTAAMSIMFWMFISYVLFIDKANRNPVYDSYKYRVKRMKTSLIEIIRSQKLSKDEKSQIIEQIEYLEQIILEADRKYPVLSTILDNLPFNRGVTSYYDFEDKIIDLMENDLHASNIKLLLVGGK